MNSSRIVNNTYIVPDGFPAVFRPDQLDKLGYTAAITLAWPTIIGGIALFLGTRDWRRYSYTPLCIAWMWSVSIVAFGIFSRFGIFNHLITFFAIVHVQTEWLIITYLLGYPFSQAYINATIAGFVIFLANVGLSGIRGAFAVLSIGGGFGDVFIPILLWHGRQRILAIGGIAHFCNALVTFIEFVEYLPLEVYLALQVIFGTAHAAFTVGGILHLQTVSSPIRLSSDSDHDFHHHLNGTEGISKPLIPPPSHEDTIKLAAIALSVSLLASIPLNLLLS